MTYCIDFFRKFKKDGNFCGLDKSQVSRLNSYLEIVELLMKQNITEETVYTNFPVKAAEPLISAKGEARTDGLNFATAALKEGKRVTQKDMQSTLQSCINATPKSCINATAHTESRPKESCSTTTSKPISAPKPEEKPKTEIPQKPENTAGNYQPGELVRTNLPPQPSLAAQMAPEAPIASVLKEKYNPEAPSFRAPCLDGKPCPEGGSVVVPDPQKPHVKKCSISRSYIFQADGKSSALLKDECLVLAAAWKKGHPPAVEGFRTADKINNTAFISKPRQPEMMIKWNPAPAQQSFLHRVMRLEGLDTPEEALSIIVDTAMSQEVV